MSSNGDSDRLDAELAAADADREKRLEEAKDFAGRLDAACRAFVDAYADLRKADKQLRDRLIDWHFVLATLNAKVKEADSEARLHESDRDTDPIEAPIRKTFLRMVASADQPKKRHEAVTIIKARSEAEQNIIRNSALETRLNLFYDLAEAVALRVVDSFPETPSEAMAKYRTALDAHLIGPCDDWFRKALFRSLDRTAVTRKAIEVELRRLDNDNWRLLVTALLDAYPNPLSTKELVDKTGIKAPGGGLSLARKNSPLLHRAIAMAGGKGKGGYRLNLASP